MVEVPRDKTFAKYRPIVELGRGGMARVFLALAAGPVGFNKLVVLKQIHAEVADEPEFLAMFLDEARLAARLNHPNVLQTYEVGADSGRYFMCMEYLEGQPLNQIWGRMCSQRATPVTTPEGRLTMGMRLQLLVEVLAGLQYAHDLLDFDGRPLSVVHRDVSPHNVFVTYAGQVKVVDFGIAKAASSSARTKTGVLKGKLAYMAPEQARGEPVDRRADVFSVGVLLWEMLTGKRLFAGMPEATILHRLVLGELPRPRSVEPTLSASLDEICMKALTQDRDGRYESAAAFAAALEKELESHDRGSMREAGKRIAAIFEADREKVRQLVESQMARAEISPLVDVNEAGAELDLPKIRDALGSLASISEDGQGERTPVTKMASLLGPERSPPRRTAVIAGVTVVAALAVGAAFLAGRGSSQPGAPSTAEVLVQPGPAAGPPPAPPPSAAAEVSAVAPSSAPSAAGSAPPSTAKPVVQRTPGARPAASGRAATRSTSTPAAPGPILKDLGI